MKRTDRIGKHFKQVGPSCMLAAWCVAGGYRYSKSRVERYMKWHKANPMMGDGGDTVEEVMDRPFARYYRDYEAAHDEAVKRRYPKQAMRCPKFTGHGTLNMWSKGGICHSVAVIDTPQGHIILDTSDRVKRIFTSYAQYCRFNRTRPTLVTFVEVT